MKKAATIGKNRTGIQMSPKDIEKMLSAMDTQLAAPSSPGDESALASLRASYIAEAEPVGTLPPPATLKGAAKSGAQMMMGERPQLLLDRLGVSRGDIRRLASPQAGAAHDERVDAIPATYQNIVAALQALGSDQVGPDDKVFIYYCGHGASLQVIGARGAALREALVPVDVGFDERGTPQRLLYDVELNALLRGIADRLRHMNSLL